MSVIRDQRTRRWAIRAGLAALGLEIAWLVMVNALLSLPATQSWVNTLKPEKVTVSWQRAWSWYPGRVEIRGAVASGQTATQQWHAEAGRVEANVALLPLLDRRVQIFWGRVHDAHYRQRPRLKPGQDYTNALPWFPSIPGYEVAPVGERPKPRKKRWTVTIHRARLEGRHSVWIQRLQARLAGQLEADLVVTSGGGTLDLQLPVLQLDIERAWADADATILNDGRLAGRMALGPYAYREHRGRKALAYLDLDLDFGLESGSLEFMELFLLKYPSLTVGGQGRAEGRFVLRHGRVNEGTDIRVDAGELKVADAPFLIEGQGQVALSVQPEVALPFTVAFGFADLAVLNHDNRAPLFTGNGLQITLEDDGKLMLVDDAAGLFARRFRASVNISGALVDDMRNFNRFLPPSSPLVFTGGSADLRADLLLTPDDAGGDFTLRGDNLQVSLDGQDLGVSLHLDGVIAGGKPSQRRFDLSGTVLGLDRAWVLGEESRFEEQDWSATATLNWAQLLLASPVGLDMEADLAISDTRPLASLFLNHGGPDWIARRLTVAGLTGSARLSMVDEDLYIPDAQLGTEELEVGMRGVIHEPANDGMVYLRYKRLDALLRIENGKRDIVIFGPRKKFDAYRIDVPGPQVGSD